MKEKQETEADGIVPEIENRIDIDSVELERLSKWKIIALTCGMIGNQLVWALQNGNASAYFLSMGMADYLVGLAWLAGPVGGIVVQPIVGQLSDTNTCRWGRRRPYMLGSLIAVVFCCLVFSNAYSIGQFFGDTEDSHIIGLCIAVIFFWALDCSINGLQSMLRALYVDLSPPSQFSEGMSWFSLMNSVGNIIGYGIGMFNYQQFGFVTNVQAIYLIGTGILILTVIITLNTGKEEPYISNVPTGEEEITESISVKQIIKQFWEMLKRIRSFPRPLWVIFGIQFISWFAWFIIMLYATVWVGVDIYGGDPNAPEGSSSKNQYDKGVRVGNAALMGQAALSIFVSLILPTLMNMIDVRALLGVAQIIQGVTMALAFWVATPWQVIVIICALAVPWSSTWTIPWTLTSTAIQNSPNKALFLGTLNLSQVLPEIICGLAANLILYFLNNIGALISIGGFIALTSLLLVPFINMEAIRSYSSDI